MKLFGLFGNSSHTHSCHVSMIFGVETVKVTDTLDQHIGDFYPRGTPWGAARNLIYFSNVKFTILMCSMIDG